MRDLTQHEVAQVSGASYGSTLGMLGAAAGALMVMPYAATFMGGLAFGAFVTTATTAQIGTVLGIELAGAAAAGYVGYSFGGALDAIVNDAKARKKQ